MSLKLQLRAPGQAEGDGDGPAGGGAGGDRGGAGRPPAAGAQCAGVLQPVRLF